MAITFTPVTPANAAFGPLGAAAWAAGMQIGGMSSTSGALLYSTDATTLAQDGTNLLYTTASGPRLQVGSSGTSVGIIAGYSGSSNKAGVWCSGITPGGFNGLMLSTAATRLCAPTGGSVFINPNAAVGVEWQFHVSGVLVPQALAVSALPTPTAGMFAYITDSTTTTWGATITGGGTNKVLGWYNGTNWTVVGA